MFLIKSLKGYDIMSYRITTLNKGMIRMSKQIKRTNEVKREQIAERLRLEPNLSNRAIGRQLNVSPHTVAKVREALGIYKNNDSCANAQLGTQYYDWLNDPWILTNKHIIDTIKSDRALRAIRSSPEVIQVMKERNVGPVRAQQLINLQRKAMIKADKGIKIADKDIDIRQDNMRAGLGWIPDQSCDIVCVDPPYGKEYIDIYTYIVRVSDRILKPNGHLLVMSGGFHLPSIFSALEQGAIKTNLKYKWTMSILLPRCSPTSLMLHGIMTGYKPVIVYKKKGPRQIKQDLIYDVIIAQDKDDKSLHKWQQSEQVFMELLNRFKMNNSDFVVADICCGSGTTISAAIKVGATNIYACDCDTKSIATAKHRVKQVLYGREKESKLK
jgi:16S rRNA G966 N2-methylase RsmD